MKADSAKYRAVLDTFWADMDVLEWAPDEKLFYLWVFTNQHLDICGCYQVSTRVMAHEMGVSVDRILELIAKFAGENKIRYCFETRELLILNWKKHNEGFFKAENKNSIRAISEGAGKIKAEELKDVVLSWLGIDIPPTLPPTQAPTPQPKPKPEPEPEPKDDDTSSQASTTPLPPTADPEQSSLVSINEFRVLFQEATGQLLPGGCNKLASELCRRYDRQKIKGAFEITAMQGGKTLKYVTSVLEDRPKPEARSRDSPSRHEAAVQRGRENLAAAMEAIYAAEGV